MHHMTNFVSTPGASMPRVVLATPVPVGQYQHERKSSTRSTRTIGQKRAAPPPSMDDTTDRAKQTLPPPATQQPHPQPPVQQSAPKRTRVEIQQKAFVVVGQDVWVHFILHFFNMRDMARVARTCRDGRKCAQEYLGRVTEVVCQQKEPIPHWKPLNNAWLNALFHRFPLCQSLQVEGWMPQDHPHVEWPVQLQSLAIDLFECAHKPLRASDFDIAIGCLAQALCECGWHTTTNPRPRLKRLQLGVLQSWRFATRMEHCYAELFKHLEELESFEFSLPFDAYGTLSLMLRYCKDTIQTLVLPELRWNNELTDRLCIEHFPRLRHVAFRLETVREFVTYFKNDTELKLSTPWLPALRSVTLVGYAPVKQTCDCKTLPELVERVSQWLVQQPEEDKTQASFFDKLLQDAPVIAIAATIIHTLTQLETATLMFESHTAVRQAHKEYGVLVSLDDVLSKTKWMFQVFRFTLQRDPSTRAITQVSVASTQIISNEENRDVIRDLYRGRAVAGLLPTGPATSTQHDSSNAPNKHDSKDKDKDDDDATMSHSTVSATTPSASAPSRTVFRAHVVV